MRDDVSYVLKWAKKTICAKELGGKCEKCGTNDVLVLQFHHLDKSTKSFPICSFKENSLEKLLPEVKKCQLLCGNCHAEVEQDTREIADDRRRRMKKAMLEYKNEYSCSACSYAGGNFASLQFHHRKAEEKKFKPVQMAYQFGLTDWVCQELDKCQVLCNNCHTKEHIDVERFHSLWSQIEAKIQSHKSKKKLPHPEILQMYADGCLPSQIAKQIGCQLQPVIYVLKRHGVYRSANG